MLAAGCSTHSHASTYGGSVSLQPSEEGGCTDTPDNAEPPGPDAEGFCGNQFLRAVGDPANIYFVIDRSGSMSERVDGLEKYATVAKAAVGLVRKIGSYANFGAAVFPSPEIVQSNDSCLV